MHIGLVTQTDNDTAMDLANSLAMAGHSVTLYFKESAFIRSNIPVDRYLAEIYDRGILHSSCRIRLYQYPRQRDPRSLMTLIKVSDDMRKDGIDVVHILAGPAEPWLSVLALLLHNLPVVTTLIVPVANIGEPLSGWVTPINYLLTHGSDLVIVNGYNQLSSVQQQYKVASDRLVHIPLGARTTSVHWLSGNVQEEAGAVLFFGRADPHKGLEYLIRAQPQITKRLPQARFLIAGRGGEIARCRNMIEDESKYEIYEGHIPGDMMAELFARASLVVLPYITASTSGVLLTAYQFGKPVVATNIGALPEYVLDGVTGLLIPPANVERLAEAVTYLLFDDMLRLQMGRAAKLWMEDENVKSVCKTLSIYEKAISLQYECKTRRNSHGV